MSTWLKRPMRAVLPTNSWMSLLERRLPEADSQTFPVGAPLKNSSGLIAVWDSGDILGLSATAGQNTTGDIFTQVYLLVPGIEIEANFLGSAAADNVLAAGDVHGKFDIAASATLLGASSAGWYIQDSTSATMVRICDLPPSTANPQGLESRVAVGDTNAIVRAIPHIANLQWYD